MTRGTWISSASTCGQGTFSNRRHLRQPGALRIELLRAVSHWDGNVIAVSAFLEMPLIASPYLQRPLVR